STPHILAIAQGFIRNQGDAWTWMLDLLMRALSDLTPAGEASASTATEQHEDYSAIAALLGRRLGEMHEVLARPSDNPDFAPEHADAKTVRQWEQQALDQIDAAFAALDRSAEWSPQAAEDLAMVRSARGQLEDMVRDASSVAQGAVLTRIHGDLHLG